ncbi:MAG: Gfo/Idh/MocA family oxidoreductase, partial [Gemmatimonadetes bacterium]|nr:Gfo/Idh/MocA family oxidoreductase [Gemmatimonadota bacterium]
MSNIRVGLIGYGGWTRLAFVPALRQHDRVRIVSAAAFSEASQDRIREELGPGVQVYGGFESLLAGPELDAVMMAIPDAIHEAAICAVLDSGVAVYYEPPLADDPE